MDRVFAGGAVTVDLDLTLFVQLGLFLVLLFILKPTLFDPMLRLFEEREKRTDGKKKEARDIDQRSAQADAEYQAVLAKARAEGTAERDALRAEGVKRETALMAEVRGEVARALELGRSEIEKEKAGARTALENEARALGREAASRVLGREITS